MIKISWRIFENNISDHLFFSNRKIAFIQPENFCNDYFEFDRSWCRCRQFEWRVKFNKKTTWNGGEVSGWLSSVLRPSSPEQTMEVLSLVMSSFALFSWKFDHSLSIIIILVEQKLLVCTNFTKFWYFCDLTV